MKTESVQYDLTSEEYTSDAEDSRNKSSILAGYLNGKPIRGRIASSGVAMGRATLIRNDDDILKVKDGAVIISKTASPKLATILSKVNAIATEIGGQSSNAMIFARECGIPALVNIPGLTEIIKDGDIVRVDAVKGIVEIEKRTKLHSIK
ncbi:MAG: PEP-utilizing enzyme [Proteobacteria bacterium]|nr:PEP-utilizing enzyme [Pseudomonadota bacterium]